MRLPLAFLNGALNRTRRISPVAIGHHLIRFEGHLDDIARYGIRGSGLHSACAGRRACVRRSDGGHRRRFKDLLSDSNVVRWRRCACWFPVWRRARRAHGRTSVCERTPIRLDRPFRGLASCGRVAVAYAAMVGVRRAPVTTAAGELRRDGATHDELGEVAIRDRAALERAACGCYAAHLQRR